MRALLGLVAVIALLPGSAWACDMYVPPDVGKKATLAELMQQVDQLVAPPVATGALADVLAAVAQEPTPVVAEAPSEPLTEDL